MQCRCSAVPFQLRLTRHCCLPQNNIKGYRYQLWCIARQVGGCLV